MIKKVTDPLKMVTDSLVLAQLESQGIDKDYVEFDDDYVKSPYMKGYTDLKSGKKIGVFSGLPMRRKDDGSKIILGWDKIGSKITSRNNLLKAVVQGTEVTVTIHTDQPNGIKKNEVIQWNPDLFVGEEKINPVSTTSIILETDPTNPDLHENVIEWDYGVCKRRIRLIQGRFRETWNFDEKPSEFPIKVVHNQTNKKLKLGSGSNADGTDLDIIVIDSDTEQVDDINIVAPFSIGASLTVFPDAHIETSTVDGHVFRLVASEDWGLVQGGAGTGHNDNSGNTIVFGMLSDDLTNKWRRIYRGIYLFDTSALGSSAVISAAVLSIYDTVRSRTFSYFDFSMVVFSSNPASNIDLVNGDYTSLGTTVFSTGVGNDDWTGGSYHPFTYNASGRAAINKTGISKFGIRDNTYDAPDNEPSWEDAKIVNYNGYFSENGSNKPKLVITYTVPQHITEAVSALIEVEMDITAIRARTEAVSALIEVEASVPATWDALWPASALIEVEADITTTLDAVSIVSALIEVEMDITAVKSRIEAVSALIEVEADITTTLDAVSAVSALIEVEMDIQAIATHYVVLGGSITPAGVLTTAATFVKLLSGEITPTGSLLISNPSWIYIPDNLNWIGVWDEDYLYSDRDVVLFQDGDNIHAFVSKTDHNVGNIPTTAYEHWTRLVQEDWNDNK